MKILIDLFDNNILLFVLNCIFDFISCIFVSIRKSILSDIGFIINQRVTIARLDKNKERKQKQWLDNVHYDHAKENILTNDILFYLLLFFSSLLSNYHSH